MKDRVSIERPRLPFYAVVGGIALRKQTHPRGTRNYEVSERAHQRVIRVFRLKLLYRLRRATLFGAAPAIPKTPSTRTPSTSGMSVLMTR